MFVGLFFLKSKPQENLFHHHRQRKATELSFVKGAGKLLMWQCLGMANFRPHRAGFFLLPSSPKLNLLRTQTSPKFFQFLAVLITIPFSCQVGYCWMGRAIIYMYFHKKLQIWSPFQLPAQVGLQKPSITEGLAWVRQVTSASASNCQGKGKKEAKIQENHLLLLWLCLTGFVSTEIIFKIISFPSIAMSIKISGFNLWHFTGFHQLLEFMFSATNPQHKETLYK